MRVGAGHLNPNDFADIITGTGPGTPGEVKVFSGKGGTQLQDYFAFTPSFTGGIFVAGGNLGGALDVVIVGADAGGASEVKVFSGAAGTQFFDFLAFAPPYADGVRVAALTGNGNGEIILATAPSLETDDCGDVIGGNSTGAEVKVINLLQQQVVDDFFASSAAYQGAFVAG